MVELQFLGTAQDAGVPQLGCSCTNCVATIDNSENIRFPACLAVYTETKTILVDATPSITQQVGMLKDHSNHSLRFDAIILTHLHIGHYLGLVMLGKEVAGIKEFPVYMTKEVYNFLKSNKPFSYLFERHNITPSILEVRTPLQIDKFCTIEPFEVVHRNEDGNTIGITIKDLQSKTKVVYIPDLDDHTKQSDVYINNADIIIIDGTFYSENELPRQANVPHPPILATIQRFSNNTNGNFFFTHFNHTNPVLKKGIEYEEVVNNGFNIAEDGMEISLR